LLLTLKLMLVPGLVAIATLAARRWGPRVGGWFTSLPIVGGPVLCFYAIEQGESFAAGAAHNAVAGLSAVAAFAAAYAWSAQYMRWPGSAVIATAVFAAATLALNALQPGLVLSAIVCVATLAAARVWIGAMPPAGTRPGGRPHVIVNLLARMTATGALVLVLTRLAAGLGPTLSGLLSVFPVATGIMALFTHAEQGRDAMTAFFRGYLFAINTFALFCFVLAVTFVPLGWVGALAVALAAQMSVNAVLLALMR